jgi:histone deacetylase 6
MQLLKSIGREEEYLIDLARMFDSVYYNRLTYDTARLSAGSAIATTLAVAKGEVKNAIAVIRPPGHHAEVDRSMGFCHFDNVAIAAKVVQQKHPEIRKIMIVDWDVHHGNGIQQAFESDPNVLYISLHVHKDGTFYPAGKYGDHLHCGIGPGIGMNINIPWPCQGMGDADYLFAFQHVIMPVGLDFDPDLVIIAAGFDAADGDTLGGCFVSPECYAHMTHMLMSLAKGKLVVCLEGGYSLRAISLSALAVTKTLMGEAPPRMAGNAATIAAVKTVHKVMRQQSKYWKCLYPKQNTFEDIPGSGQMHGQLFGKRRKHRTSADVFQILSDHTSTSTFSTVSKCSTCTSLEIRYQSRSRIKSSQR